MNLTEISETAVKRKNLKNRTFLNNQDNLNTYMQTIKQIPLLDSDQEKELANRILHGETEAIREEARNELISANLRLVVKIAYSFLGLGLNLAELVSEGNAGLVRAVREYDPSKGAKFSYYASWWIKLSMRQAVTDRQEAIRLPQEFAVRQRKYKQVYLHFREKFMRDPTDSELAELLGCSERVARNVRQRNISTISLNDHVSSDESSKELLNLIPDESSQNPDQALCQREELQSLKKAIEGLTYEERKILSMRFGLETGAPQTLELVSRELGKTRERVRQIQMQAISKLRGKLSEGLHHICFRPSGKVWKSA